MILRYRHIIASLDLAHLPSSLNHAFTFFFFSCSGHHRDLHSFPTRRSSDLGSFDSTATSYSAALGGIGSHVWSAVLNPASFEVDRKSTRLNSSHVSISYAVFCLKKKKKQELQ